MMVPVVLAATDFAGLTIVFDEDQILVTVVDFVGAKVVAHSTDSLRHLRHRRIQ